MGHWRWCLWKSVAVGSEGHNNQDSGNLADDSDVNKTHQ